MPLGIYLNISQLIFVSYPIFSSSSKPISTHTWKCQFLNLLVILQCESISDFPTVSKEFCFLGLLRSVPFIQLLSSFQILFLFHSFSPVGVCFFEKSNIILGRKHIIFYFIISKTMICVFSPSALIFPFLTKQNALAGLKKIIVSQLPLLSLISDRASMY